MLTIYFKEQQIFVTMLCGKSSKKKSHTIFPAVLLLQYTEILGTAEGNTAKECMQRMGVRVTCTYEISLGSVKSIWKYILCRRVGHPWLSG